MKILAPARKFLLGWQQDSARAYHYQYGVYLAIPIVWGCLDAFLWPSLATIGFFFSAWFLESRFGIRIILQVLIFVFWSCYLTEKWPRHFQTSLTNHPYQFEENAQKQSTKLMGTLKSFTLSPRCSFILSTHDGLIKVLAAPPSFQLQAGQGLRIEAVSEPPQPPTNPGQFDYPQYLLSLGIRKVYRASSIELIRPPNWFQKWVNTAHLKLNESLSNAIPPDNAPLVLACLLGSVENLDPEIISDFKASGMLHILAISGQHIGLLALILLQLFSFLRIPRKLGFALSAILIGFYVPVCGSSISVLRSAIMFAVILPGIIWERPVFTMNNLGWAAVFCLSWMPYQILSLGFQLSFLASFFLILYVKTITKFLEQLRIKSIVQTYLFSTVALSVLLYLAVYPVLASSVHTAAPSSILGNLATICLSSGMLITACLTLLFSPIPFISQLFGETSGAFAHALSWCIHRLAHSFGSAHSIQALSLFWGLLLLMILLVGPYAFRNQKAKILILMAIMVFAGRWVFAEAKSLVLNPWSVHYLDVGQGDGILLQLPGAAILIDAGPVKAGQNVILPFLRSAGINHLDLVVITHPDLDHYGGLEFLAENISIGKVCYPGIESDANAWSALQKTLAKHKIPLRAVHRGEILYKNKEIMYSVLSPGFVNQFPERNDNSVVTLLTIKQISSAENASMPNEFLFTGDLEGHGQKALLEHHFPKLTGAVLKVPHHGSDHSNPTSFLEAIHPNFSILSAGRKNRYGHPGPTTMAALEALGSKIFLTARQGEVSFHASGRQGEWNSYLAREYNASKNYNLK